jgi:predicted RNA-binding protein Jag
MDWLEIVGTIFEIAIFPAISAAAIYFITWINAKKQELLKKTKNETETKYVEMLDKTITECVLSTSQTYVKALKEEGRFDEAAQKVAFQKTFDAVMAILTDEAQTYLSEITKDLGVYITNKIEATVKATK